MNKHFYFGVSVFSVLFLYILEAIGADVSTLLLVGFAFILVLLSVLLHEMCEHRQSSERKDQLVSEQLEDIKFDIQIMRDCNFDALRERSGNILQMIETLSKFTEQEQESAEETATPSEGTHRCR